MYLQEHTKLCILHAISPVHAGAGSATGAVDLPVQREAHTGWPHIQASGVKGAFRDHCEQTWMLQDLEVDLKVENDKKKRAEELANRIFGQSNGKNIQAGAIAFSDAKLLAFPVRSNLAPFVWVTCPALIQRLRRDLKLAGLNDQLPIPKVQDDHYLLIQGEFKGDLILEDICLKKEELETLHEVKKLYQKLVPEVERLVLIPDQHFSFLMETATEIQTQIKIKADTGTTQDGSLRYEELLPADTTLYSLVFFGKERAEETKLLELKTLEKVVRDAASTHIQIGGDLTLGRGIFELTWLDGENIKEGGNQ